MSTTITTLPECGPFVGDIGIEILLNMQEDITGATSTVMIVTKTDGTVVSWAATISGTNFLRYVTIDGDLDQVGDYTIQPDLVLSGFNGNGGRNVLPVASAAPAVTP